MYNLRRWIVFGTGVAFSLFHLYTSGFASLPDQLMGAWHLGFIMVLAFLVIPKRGETAKKSWDTPVALFLAASSVLVAAYLIVTYESFIQRVGQVTKPDIVFGVIMVVLVLEAARRTVGWVIALIAVAFLCMGLLGPYLPGFLANRGYSVERIAYQMYMTTSGIYGVPLNVSANMITLFVIFGSFLDHSGAGKMFIDVAFSLTGRSRGGPAKAAVVSSALMGTISGSAPANVAVTGTFTIPLMKRAGYNATTAGAIEAVASTGGQIMPPIMASAAFVMSELTGIPYIQICIAAVPSALLYFVTIFAMVHFSAIKLGLQGTPSADLPNFGDTLKQGLHLVFPFGVLVYMLSSMYSPGFSAFWAVVATIAACMMRKNTRLDLNGFLISLRDGGVRMVEVAVTCAVAGIITGMINLTGLGVTISSILISVADGSLFILLLLTMFTSIVLGMGMPTVAAYLMLAVLVGPALTEVGLSQMQAHFFILYFGTVSTITPPVALAAFTAAGIAEAKPMQVGLKAVVFGIAAYIVPFMFAYNESLLFQGPLQETFFAVITALIGCCGLAAGLQGQLITLCRWLERFILAAGGLVLIIPGWRTDLAGIGLIGLVCLIQWRRVRANKVAPIAGQVGHTVNQRGTDTQHDENRELFR